MSRSSATSRRLAPTVARSEGRCRAAADAAELALKEFSVTPLLRALLIAATMVAAGAGTADAGHEGAPHPDLGRLIEQFNAAAPRHEGSVQLDAWIETGSESDELVVVLEPQGAFKLVADPGITVTPSEQPGVEWLVPLPHRHVDPETPYFMPPAAVRLPFRADGGGQPLEILVEYAYCVVDYQCFFGEELLSVSARYD